MAASVGGERGGGGGDGRLTERQTLLFSATQTTKVEDLARVSLRKNPLYVNVEENREEATVEGLEQGYVVCASDQRFLLLFTFLKKNLNKKKVIVFFSSCNSVKFHAELLNYIDIPVLDLHVRDGSPRPEAGRARLWESGQQRFLTHAYRRGGARRICVRPAPGPAKAAEAHQHVLRVLQRRDWDPVVH